MAAVLGPIVPFCVGSFCWFGCVLVGGGADEPFCGDAVCSRLVGGGSED